MKRLATLTTALAVTGLLGATAHAFVVPPTNIRGAPGSVHLLATQPVPTADQGRSCPVVVVTVNNTSVHPGNDILVTSGSTFVAAGVEDQSGASRAYNGTITLGATITVSVRLGPDGEYSGGAQLVTVDCPPVTTTTTTPTTTPPPTPIPAPPTPVVAAPRLTG